MTQPLSPAPQAATGPEPAPACTLVIFGAGGDLTKRLLMPALYNLARSHLLDGDFAVIGVDHHDNDDEGWRAALSETMHSFTQDEAAEFHVERIEPAAWDWVLRRLRYLSADFERPETYQTLAEALQGRSAVFYLAVAAQFFGPVAERLGQAGLLNEPRGAFRRLVIEKPFGEDLQSATSLNRRILRVADESQCYRIDHFLGKDTVQSILALRFANALFEPLWRAEYIDHVQITAAETIGVEGRGAFYEATGALRDMVPNHLFQLLSLFAMEPPTALTAEAVRSEKAKLFQAMSPVDSGDVVRGQYARGRVHGETVAGYREEPRVAADSATETYVTLKLGIENERWSGVPFYLRTGKRLSARRTEIAVQFKPSPQPAFSGAAEPAANMLRLLIEPIQGCEIAFNIKAPGPVMRVAPVSATFLHERFFAKRSEVGYETLLYRCMIGDPTLFQREDAIEASWAAVEPALAAWSRGEGTVEPYEAGCAGPPGADELLAPEGRSWLPLDEVGS